MNTASLEKLLESWELEQLSVETAIGHILQALLMQGLEIKANTITLHYLRRKIDSLIAHTGLKPPSTDEN